MLCLPTVFFFSLHFSLINCRLATAGVHDWEKKKKRLFLNVLQEIILKINQSINKVKVSQYHSDHSKNKKPYMLYKFYF